MLKVKGNSYLRQRLVLSTLSSKPTMIEEIRERDDELGLKDHEASLIRLLDKLTNGSRFEINETGTKLGYWPGLLQGGVVEHECSKERGIGYFLEPILMLAPFAKEPIKLTLRGCTSAPNDPSVDYYKMVVVPLMKRMIDSVTFDLDIEIKSRGIFPGGGGEIVFFCPNVRRIKPIRLLDDNSKVKKIRGLVHCQKVNTGVINRVVESARGVLNSYLPDVYIYTDWVQGQTMSSGYGLLLVSESIDGTRHAAEKMCNTPDSLPEDLGRDTANALLRDVLMGGCTDLNSQIIPLLYMVMSHYDVSKICLGRLSNYTIEFLRLLKEYFGVVFKIDCSGDGLEDDIEREKVTLTCVGIGYSNVGKPNR